MQKIYKPARIGVIFVFMAIVLTIYVSALYKIQIFDVVPAEVNVLPTKTIKRSVTLPAARGNIYDRNGVLLASGRTSYNITLNREALLAVPEINSIVLDLINTMVNGSIRYNDSLPITQGAPFSYISNMSAEQRRRLDAYFEFFRLDPEISASDLLAWMRENYKIDYTVGISDARLITGVRYELEIRAIMGNLPSYVFANDIGSGMVSFIEERTLIGVYIESGYIREYHTSYAAHLLGYIARIRDNQIEKYVTELGYPLDATIGQTGVEAAFEDVLHGADGKQTIIMDESGAVVGVEIINAPEPGKHVYLTIDIGLQASTEDALRTHIDSTNLEIEDESERIPGGAVVVTDVWTGEILAMASYPTFDRATLSQNITALNADPNRPMFNRATQGLYNPGSTFKMVTAFAGLRHGVIGRWTPINDTGRYSILNDVGATYTPQCWYYQLNGVGHSELDVVQALQRSCNYFFCHVSDRLEGGGRAGAEALAQAARELGLGQKTGLEVPEQTGILATPEYKEEFLTDKNWYRADTVMASFGQGYNQFTPVQLSNYAATIANGGTLHSLTLLRRIKSTDMSETIFSHAPVVANEIEEAEYIEIVQEGMRAVASTTQGTAYSVFGDYPVKIAAKTGTVQAESSTINTGVFVCYAPAASPEVSISVVIEKGGSGSQVMGIARTVLDDYFKADNAVLSTPDGELIP